VAAGAPPAAAAPLHGIQIAKVGEGDPVRDVVVARSLGAKVVRSEIPWNALEPDAAGVKDPVLLGQADALMAKARETGVKVVLIVAGTPCWASAAPAATRGDCTTGDQRRQAAAYPPSRPADFAAVAGFLAGRYATSLAAFEVWNEPDQANELYFAGPDKPARYAALLKAAYPAIKRAAPRVPVLGGSLVGFNGVFLKALYKAGIKGSYDALSVHYYDLVLASLRAIRKVQRANGDSKPVWLAEYGWTSCRPARTQGGHNCVSAAKQGANITDIVRALARTTYLRGAILYNLHDTGRDDFGVLDRTGARKRAFAATRSAWTTPGSLRPVVLRLTRSGGSLVASGSAPAGDALELDLLQRGAARYRVVFRLDREGRYRLRLPALARRGMTVVVTQYWSGRRAARRIG
ncbi:MAG: hypothetical protein JWP18_533, partial [Solirubrobacterales bacterium]|nr:hypothetical protein [Solirubrobacterales bacterium]